MEEIETVDAELVRDPDAGPASGRHVAAYGTHEEEPRTEIEPSRRALPPAAVAAGVAVGGVAAGMATVAIVQHRAARKAARRRRKMLGKVVASRSFLLDVHVLDR